MPFNLSSLDVHYLVREIRPLLTDAFVDKIYQGEDRTQFLIRMRSPKHGKQQLFIKVPEALFLTNHRYPWPQNPPGFCMQLRKHLGNAKLLSIEQHGFERIVILNFQKGDTKWKLVIELFSKGNVCLVNEENLIRGVMSLQRWSGRTLRVNEEFQFPPAVTNTPALSKDQLETLFEQESKELVKFCAISLSLGGKYAEELVFRNGLDKKLTTLTDQQQDTLHSSLQKLFTNDVEACTNSGDAAPFAPNAWKEADIEAHQSFSDAVESVVVAEKLAVIDDEEAEVHSSHKNKYQRIIDQQSNKLKGYELAAVDNQKKGEIIYENYAQLQEMILLLKEAHKKGAWTAVKALIEEKGWPISVNEASAAISFSYDE